MQKAHFPLYFPNEKQNDPVIKVTSSNNTYKDKPKEPTSVQNKYEYIVLSYIE